MDKLVVLLAVASLLSSHFCFSYQWAIIHATSNFRPRPTISSGVVQSFLTPAWMGWVWWLSIATAVEVAVLLWPIGAYAAVTWLSFYFIGLNLLPALPFRRFFVRLAVGELKRSSAAMHETHLVKAELLRSLSGAADENA